DNVIVSQVNTLSLNANYVLYNLRTNKTSLLFRSSGRSTPALFDPRNGELLAKFELKADTSDFEQEVQILNRQTREFETHDALNHTLTDRHTVVLAGMDESTGNFYVLTDLLSDR